MSVVPKSGRYAIVPNWVRAQANIYARDLYGLLAGVYADRRGVCHPSRATIAQDMGVSVDTVDRAVKELERIGALTVVRRIGNKGPGTVGNLPNLYTLNADDPSGNLAATQRVPSRRKPTVTRVPSVRTPDIDSKESIHSAREDADVETVWQRWLTYHPTAIVKPVERIRARLKTFSADQLIAAIDNHCTDVWIQEHIPNKPLEWLFMTNSKVEERVQPRPAQSTASVRPALREVGRMRPVMRDPVAAGVSW